ncbi:MFS family permease [Bradyrhizobium sp. GM24.11]
MSDHTVLLTEAERARVVMGVSIAMFLSALDQMIVSPAIPAIGAELGDELWLSWVISAYFLTSTAATPLFGKLADLGGRQWTLHLCIVMFVAGSLVCALAPMIGVLIGGRAIQGIAHGGLGPVAQTIIADMVPPRERGRYYTYISTLWAVSSAAGPVVGGVLTEHVHWSMIFWINLPIGSVL